MTTKRVAMNLLWCVPGVGGSEEYLVRQLLGLLEITHDYSVEVFAPRGFSQRQPHIAKHYTIYEAPNDCSRREVRIAMEHTWLAWRTRSFDMVHHGGGTLPRIGHSSTLVTIHDIQWTEYPHYVAPLKLRYLKKVVPYAVTHATRIAVPSQFVKNTLVEKLNASPHLVGVVRHGLESDLHKSVTPEALLREKFALGSGPVVVFPAITHPHKNHVFLLQLLTQATGPWANPSLKVVFAGSAGSHEEVVRTFIAEHGLSSRVVMPGRVSHEDRNGLLAMADAMAFPSEYEGFGAPVIEAMRLGAPVICSDKGSLPEVVGTAGMVCPLTAEAWNSALHNARDQRAEWARKGHERALEFTVALSASDLVQQYDMVMNGGSK